MKFIHGQIMAIFLWNTELYATNVHYVLCDYMMLSSLTDYVDIK